MDTSSLDGAGVAAPQFLEETAVGTPAAVLPAGALAPSPNGTPEGEPVPADGEADAKEPRRKRGTRPAEDEGEEGDSVARLAPMVRHLAALTKELTEAQRTVGTLTAERDRLQRQLAERPAPELALVEGENGPVRPGKEARIGAKLEAKAAKQAERTVAAVELEPFPTPEELADRAQEAGRRRRLIALGVVATIAAVFLIGGAMDIPVGDYVSKNGVTGIPYFGLIFQMLIVGFMIYRVVRVGGKARDWLFPAPEEPKKRRR